MEGPGPTSHRFVSQRLRLHYLDWGNGDRPLLLLIHGGRDHARSWDWTARALRDDWHIVAPDLRGHGDSAWAADGNYTMAPLVYDLAQLVHQLGEETVTIVGHSLGGSISLRFAGLYPERVRRLVAIEGVGMSPQLLAEREARPLAERWREWIVERRAVAARRPRRYASLAEAVERMSAANPFLTAEQALHLTIHGLDRHEDGSYGWKFDPCMHLYPLLDWPQPEIVALRGAIRCPTLLLYGADSWATNPERDGRIRHFHTARVVELEQAGHWLHHDQFDRFLAELRAFL